MVKGINLTYKGMCEMVGAYLPQPLVQRLRLGALCEDTTLTKAIQDALEYSFKASASTNQLIKILGDRFFKDWQSQVIKGTKDNNFKTFQEELRRTLEDNGLTESNIAGIISVVKEKHEKNKT